MNKLTKFIFVILSLSIMISCVCFVSFAAESGSGSVVKDNIFIQILIALAIGFIVALIVTGTMKAKLKSVRAQNAAANYTREGSFNVTESREIFLYKETKSTPIQKDNNND